MLAFLGRGGSGEVYRARPPGGGPAVALKVLRHDRADLAARMRREAGILAAHPHPALPRLLSAGEEGGVPYLVLEELAPRDLPSRDRDVAAFLLALCGGVEHLHRLGFVHRDIKPSNILCRADGSPVLIDLGLVKDLAEEEAPAPDPDGGALSAVTGGAVGVGTPGYSAPEQFAGGRITPSADVYALGVLADECFAHRPPRCWRALLRRATSALGAERPDSAAAFARAIRRRHWPGKPALLAALAAAAAATAAALALRAPPVPGNAPWTLSFPAGIEDAHWNATMTDGNWFLAACAAEGTLCIKPDYSHGNGVLDLAKPIRDGDGRPWTLTAVGLPPLDGGNPEFPRTDRLRLAGEVSAIRLPDTLVELGAGALMNCGTLREIDLPDSLRRIGPWAFSGCRSLRRLSIPAGVEDVSDDRTFLECESLEAIDTAPGNPAYRSDGGVLLSADGTRLVAYPPGRPAGSYAIPEGVEAIPGHLFARCLHLKSVSVPATVREIGPHAFAGCRSLATVTGDPAARVRLLGNPFLHTAVRQLPWNAHAQRRATSDE